MNASKAIKKLERLGNELPSHAFPGGYPLFYMDTLDCVLCAPCATSQVDDSEQYKVITVNVHWEGDSLECDKCGFMIKSAYGEDTDNDA